MAIGLTCYRHARARRFPAAGGADGSYRRAWLALALVGSVLLGATLLIQLAG